mmetsp:Transcript_28990/g.67429  ORF Transcript_28990/g.67429 Transcript_28990/m.67429 type:complete len:201 (+) Transcript_28990:144-746(+)
MYQLLFHGFPFSEDSSLDLTQQIRLCGTGSARLHLPNVAGVSEAAGQMVRNLLCPATFRMSAATALSDPWMCVPQPNAHRNMQTRRLGRNTTITSRDMAAAVSMLPHAGPSSPPAAAAAAAEDTGTGATPGRKSTRRAAAAATSPSTGASPMTRRSSARLRSSSTRGGGRGGGDGLEVVEEHSQEGDCDSPTRLAKKRKR